jgi:hypothetical protein
MDRRTIIFAIVAGGLGAGVAEWFDAPTYVTTVWVGAVVVVAWLLSRDPNDASTAERER